MTERLPGRRSTGWLPSAFRLLLRTCAHRHGRRYSGPRPPRNDRVAGRALQSLRPGRAALRGRLRGCWASVRGARPARPPAPSPRRPPARRPPGTSSWPRPPPHWWQPSSSVTASEAVYASFAAAARRMSADGCGRARCSASVGAPRGRGGRR